MNLDIFIIGAYGSGNLGDDVLLKVLMRELDDLTQSDQIGVLCHPAPYMERLVDKARLVSRGRSDNVNAKVCLYGGGTQFFKFRNPSKWFNRLKLAIANPGFAIRWLLGKSAQKIHAEKYAMIGIGFGPFEDADDFAQDVSRKIGACEMVSVRDIWSYEFAQSKGHKHVALGADIAFRSSFRIGIEKEAKSHQQNSTTDHGSIAFILRDWSLGGGHENSANQAMLAAERLKDQGFEIDFVIFSRDPDLDRSKLAQIGQIVQWDPENQTEESFIGGFQKYQLVITARYHGAVFSFLLDRPVIGICVDPKISLFMDQIEQGEFKWNLPYDVDELVRLVDLRLDTARTTSSSERANEIRDELSDRADKMFLQARELLKLELDDVAGNRTS